MLRKRYWLYGLLLLLLALLYFVFFGRRDAALADRSNDLAHSPAYRRQLETARRDKDRFFRTSARSPLPDTAGFTGLRYFAPDPAYRLTARLEPFADKTQKLVVVMSDGSEEVYDKFAHAVFRLNGETARLLIVKMSGTYSILFRDSTSGRETYGGGRYLELDPAELTDTSLLLDFNKAYNPYCAYNPAYACPLPPAENTLPVAVRAGEQYEHR